MEVVIKNHKKDDIIVNMSFSHSGCEDGTQNVFCSVDYMKDNKIFSIITSSFIIDEIEEMKSIGTIERRIQRWYFESVFYEMRDSIVDWCISKTNS